MLADKSSRASKLPSEPLFFGDSLEDNRAAVESRLRPGITQKLRPRTNLDALVGFLACTALASTYAFVLASSPRSPMSPPTAALLCWVFSGLWIATDRLAAVRESHETALTLRQIEAVYRAYEATGAHYARASNALCWLEDERTAGRLLRPAVRALDELHAFLLADAREYVRELSLLAYAWRVERELLACPS